MKTIGLYIHVPFCRHACPYCDFYKFELRDRPASLRLGFLETVAAELRLLLARHPHLRERKLATVYFGGGTPSTLHPGRFRRFLDQVFSEFPHREDSLEVTLEANPENLTAARCRQWQDAGVNRLSIGVQSFHAGDLELLERLHAPETIHRAVENARGAGISNYSIDLMFALPGQTMEAWMDNLRQAVGLVPRHISLYGLTWHEGTPFHRHLAGGRLATAPEDLEADMFLGASEFLRDHGFEHYEVSNYALPESRSVHNQRYWTGADVLPLGPGAHGNLGNNRWANPDDIDAWNGAIGRGVLPGAPLDDPPADVLLAERIYTRLRRSDGISRMSDPDLHGACVRWLETLDGEERQRWVVADGERLQLTPEGWLLLDPIVDKIMTLT
ncbi:MAG: radical SAM family heme chaperone HemW [Candidatus Sumerlaeia bacterium]|nr:radical SAM family heme chaperone HemW [Candidatus Sumerlaeia bacterium]